MGGVPRIAVRRADDATLARAGHAAQPATESEVNQLDVVHRDIGAGIAAADPLGELARADRFRFQQRAIAVVDMLAVRRRPPKFAAACDRGPIACDTRPSRAHFPDALMRLQFVQFRQRQHRRLFDQQMLARPRARLSPRKNADRRARRRKRNRRPGSTGHESSSFNSARPGGKVSRLCRFDRPRLPRRLEPACRFAWQPRLAQIRTKRRTPDRKVPRDAASRTLADRSRRRSSPSRPCRRVGGGSARVIFDRPEESCWQDSPRPIALPVELPCA